MAVLLSLSTRCQHAVSTESLVFLPGHKKKEKRKMQSDFALGMVGVYKTDTPQIMFDGQQCLAYGQLTSLIHEAVWTDTWKR